MCRTRRSLVVLALVPLLALVLASCHQRTGTTATELTSGRALAEQGSVEPQPASLDTYDFSLDLLRACATEEPDENTLVSPLSVLYALSMVENGASGETLAQIETATGMSADALSSALQSRAVRAADDDSQLSLANSVWLRDSDGLRVSDDYLDACATNLGAQAYAAPFDDTTADDINGWVSDHTHEMIPSIVEDIPDQAQLYLVNALAFEAPWQDPYNPAFTEPDTFTCEDGTTQDVDMMLSMERSYLEGELATGFVRPYEGYEYGFVGLLPNEGVTVSDLLASLDGTSLQALLEPRPNTVADVGLPRFTVTYGNELSEELASLGVTDVFDQDRADLTRMGTSDNGPLYASAVLHKTFIDVNEEGTSAAATTVVEVGDGAAAQDESPEVREVVCDRPFVYLIVDYATMTPVFIGTVMSVE